MAASHLSRVPHPRSRNCCFPTRAASAALRGVVSLLGASLSDNVACLQEEDERALVGPPRRSKERELAFSGCQRFATFGVCKDVL
jgi:hypothetical protein